MSAIATLRFATAHGGDPSALCHGIRLRFATATAAKAAARRLEAAGAAIGLRAWREDVLAPALAELARHREAAEAARGIAAGAPPARAVLLRYAGQRADLIVVSRRSFLDGPRLRQLGELLHGDAPGQALGPLLANAAGPAQAQAQVPARPPAAPAWGLGDRLAAGGARPLRLAAQPAAPPGDEATWLAALTIVLARRDPEAPVAAGLLAEAAGALTVPAPDLARVTLADLTTSVRAALAGPAAVGPVAAAQPTVGIVVMPDSPPGLEYIPCQGLVFPLTICVTTGAGGVRLRCLYSPGHFARSVVQRLARQLLAAHRQVCQEAGRTVAAVDLLDAASRDELATLGRSPAPPRSRPACIHELIAEHARARPTALAVSDGKQQLAYAKLDGQADQLAHGLRELGVRDGDRVGVCLERSVELVTTLLAVLKAGAVYVPMDPAYPAERLGYMTADAGLRVVIGHPGEFPDGAGVRVISPRDLADLGIDCPPGPPPSGVTPGHPAYAIYTSGSTGRPKGVLVPHANVAALIDATREEYQLGPEDRWTLFHSSAFDFSVWEIWGCLLTGARLIVVPHWVSRSPDEFATLLAEEQVTVLSQTPSAFAQLLQADRAEPRDLRVRLIVFGGEPLDARMMLPWFDRHPEAGCRVVNMFGITETTVHVTAQTITRRHALDGSRSVGRALPGWHLYVTDHAGRLVAPGVAGEICVGGAGVALGYLGRPGLTSERFVPDPVAGRRMYRSGDKGRLLPDGTLEHLGRLDSQVKVRGFRIELDEIRNVLLELPGVLAAAVVVGQPGDAASARIDAYVVLAGEGGTTGGLRGQVARILPDYMVPTSITALPSLPLTTNGKLDAARLPAPASPARKGALAGKGIRAGNEAPARRQAPIPGAPLPPGSPHTAPAARTAAQPAQPGEPGQETRHFARDLQSVWLAVLSAQAGLDDDFFELGGNSLYAVRVAAAMRDLGWPRIPIRDIYQNPTIRRLATSLGHPATLWT